MSLVGTRRVFGHIVAIMLVALSALLGSAGAASAHSQIIWSNPTNGQRVETTPEWINLILSEKPDLIRSTFQLTQHDIPIPSLGTPELVRPVVDPKAGIPEGAYEIRIPVNRALADGVYRLGVFSVSADDGHKERGSLVFGVRMDVSQTETNALTLSSLAEGLNPLRQFFTYAVVIAAGLALGIALLVRAIGDGTLRGLRAARIVAEDIVLGGGMSLGVLTVGAGATKGWWLIGGSALGAALIAIGTRGHSPARVPAPILAFVGLVCATAPLALVGHSSGKGGVAIAISAIHLVATAAWSGVVLSCLFLVRSGDRELRLAHLRRVSAVAAPAFATSVLTGILLVGENIPSVGALTTSAYSWATLLKVALVAVLAVAGLRMRVRLSSGRVGPVRFEGALLALTALIGVMLATLPAPVGPQFAATPTWKASDEPVETVIDGTIATFQMDPNQVGQAYLQVNFEDSIKPAAVRVQVGGNAPVPLGPTADGSWVARALVTSPGPTDVLIYLSRTGRDDASGTLNYIVGAVPGMLDGGPVLKPWTWVAAGAFGIVLIGFFLVETAVRRRARRLPGTPDATSESPVASSGRTLSS